MICQKGYLSVFVSLRRDITPQDDDREDEALLS